jgi:hypothetical protein
LVAYLIRARGLKPLFFPPSYRGLKPAANPKDS